jgi:hypothetical protein
VWVVVFPTSKNTNSGYKGILKAQQRPLLSNGSTVGPAASYLQSVISVEFSIQEELMFILSEELHCTLQRENCFIHTPPCSLREKQLSRQKQSISAWSLFLVDICKQDILIGQSDNNKLHYYLLHGYQFDTSICLVSITDYSITVYYLLLKLTHRLS